MCHCSYRPIKRVTVSQEPKEVAKPKLEQFVTKNTMKFFNLLGLPCEFMQVDPQLWPQREDYKQGLILTKQLKVVNDNAEIAVALIEEYNSCITKNEEQKQFLLLTVQEHCLVFPNSLKTILMNN